MIEIKELGNFKIDENDSTKGMLHTFFTARDEDIILYFSEQEDGSVIISDNGKIIKDSVFERGEDMDEIVFEICENNLVELNENECLSKTIINPVIATEKFYFMEIVGLIQTCILISNLV